MNQFTISARVALTETLRMELYKAGLRNLLVKTRDYGGAAHRLCGQANNTQKIGEHSNLSYKSTLIDHINPQF
jgi:hypothetical protein